MDMDMTIDKLKNYGADFEGALKRFVDDAEFYCACLVEIKDDKNFNILENAINTKDYVLAFDAAHTLKGVTGNLGLTPLYISVCALVESLRVKEYGHIDMEYETVSRQYAELKKLIDDVHNAQEK